MKRGNFSARLCGLTVLVATATILSFSCSKKDPTGSDPKVDPPKDTALTRVGALSFSGFNRVPGLILVEYPFAYVACTNGSFMVIDVSDTLDLHVVDSFPVVGDSLYSGAYGGSPITKSGSLLCYVAYDVRHSAPCRAQIFSVSPQGEITYKSSILRSVYDPVGHIYNCWSFGNATLSGNLLYLDGDVYDVSSPSSPQSLGHLDAYYSLGYQLPFSQSPVVIYENYAVFTGVYMQHPRLWVCDRTTRQIAGTLDLPDTIGYARLSIVSGAAYLYSFGHPYVAEISLAEAAHPVFSHIYNINELTTDGMLWFSDTRIGRSRYNSAHSLDVGLAICDLNFNRVKANDTLEVYACAITPTFTYVINSTGLTIFRTP